MPNTLIHIAIQAPLSRTLFPRIEIPWVLAGAIIPDIPWIFQRILLAGKFVDPYWVRLYCTIQASLVFCLLLSLVLSTFAQKPLPLFLLLAGNSLGHLLLDALQIKWGNGVILSAPLSWQITHVGLIWPEHILGYGATLLGALYLILMSRIIHREGLPLLRYPSWKITAMALSLYFLLPPLFMNQAEQANVNYIKTLEEDSSRIGKHIEIDRSYYSREAGTITLFSGESLLVTGALPDESGTISIKAEFTGAHSLQSLQYHKHNSYRDFASIAGLFLSLSIWLSLLTFKYRLNRIPIKK